MTTVNRDGHQEYPRSNLAQDTDVPRVNEEYSTQVFEEIEEKVIKKVVSGI